MSHGPLVWTEAGMLKWTDELCVCGERCGSYRHLRLHAMEAA